MFGPNGKYTSVVSIMHTYWPYVKLASICHTYLHKYIDRDNKVIRLHPTCSLVGRNNKNCLCMHLLEVCALVCFFLESVWYLFVDSRLPWELHRMRSHRNHNIGDTVRTTVTKKSLKGKANKNTRTQSITLDAHDSSYNPTCTWTKMDLLWFDPTWSDMGFWELM